VALPAAVTPGLWYSQSGVEVGFGCQPYSGVFSLVAAIESDGSAMRARRDELGVTRSSEGLLGSDNVHEQHPHEHRSLKISIRQRA